MVKRAWVKRIQSQWSPEWANEASKKHLLQFWQLENNIKRDPDFVGSN